MRCQASYLTNKSSYELDLCAKLGIELLIFQKIKRFLAIGFQTFLRAKYLVVESHSASDNLVTTVSTGIHIP